MASVIVMAGKISQATCCKSKDVARVDGLIDNTEL